MAHARCLEYLPAERNTMVSRYWVARDSIQAVAQEKKRLEVSWPQYLVFFLGGLGLDFTVELAPNQLPPSSSIHNILPSDAWLSWLEETRLTFSDELYRRTVAESMLSY